MSIKSQALYQHVDFEVLVQLIYEIFDYFETFSLKFVERTSESYPSVHVVYSIELCCADFKITE